MCILYVEDDPLLRRQVYHELTKHNYDVIVACDGAEACRLLDSYQSSVDMLITDVNLGGDVDGWTLAEYARNVLPGVAVIYATGSKVSRALVVENSVAVFKPFTPNSLNEAIAESARLRRATENMTTSEDQ